MYQRQVGFGEAVRRAFSNYCNFSGRASRSEYWWFFLFNFIVTAVLSAGHGASLSNSVTSNLNAFSLDTFSVLTYIWGLIVLLPTLGLSWRRLHDIGKGGGWYFIGLVPVVGQILLIVWFCQGSQAGDNRFGPVPNLV